jgi:hypothetical protein
MNFVITFFCYLSILKYVMIILKNILSGLAHAGFYFGFGKVLDDFDMFFLVYWFSFMILSKIIPNIHNYHEHSSYIFKIFFQIYE